MCSVILRLKIKPPKYKEKLSINAKAHNKTSMDKEDVVPPHGAINKAEAECHRQKLQQTIINLKTNANDFILATKTCCEEIYPPIRNADVKKVLHSMGDPYGLAI